ncbi:MAG TPA: acetate kinase [Candidatus Omnitrophica bacterium]|nr:acetate kinase [Candidatus Omnitrophota bacterium]
MNILVINSGSSSIKYQVFKMPQRKVLHEGVIENIGEKSSRARNHAAGLKLILSEVGDVSSVGHRVVHGGENLSRPVFITKSIINKIEKASVFAPLHNPANLSGIIACKKILKGKPQVAVFDTAFHQDLPERAYIYGLPYSYYKNSGIRKYGFHGSSHEYIARSAARLLRKPLNKVNLITCHLGNGASITAVSNGRSIDTSMGLTPLEGVVMGTRCGDVDAGVITYLARIKKWSIAKLAEVLNRESGLKGISGLTNDMRRLQKEAARGNKRACLAVEIFIYRIRKYIGAYLAVLGRVDMVVFSGGIGENQKTIRQRIVQGLFNNLKVRPKVCVIKTREELLIAEKTYALMKSKIKNRM